MTVTSPVPKRTLLAFMILMIGRIYKSCRVYSFADYAKIMIEKPEDINISQREVYKLFRWVEINNMLFNKDKFKLLKSGKPLILVNRDEYIKKQ